MATNNKELTNKFKKVLVLNDHDESKEAWGVSFDGPNPDLEDYVECFSEDDAFKLRDLILKLS